MAFGSRRHPCRLASVWVVLSGVCVGVCAGVFEEDCSLKKKRQWTVRERVLGQACS